MRKFLFILVALSIGLKIGWDYVMSEDFQAYGDRTKAEWTCQVDFWMAEYYVVLSEYPDAWKLFHRGAERCPKTEIGEKCAFEYAHCLESGGKRGDAVAAYLKFIEDYPDSARARLAQKSIDMLRTA